MVWALVGMGLAIALLGVLVLGLLRSHALILKALHELGAGLELEKEASAHTDHAHDDATASVGPVPVSIEPGVTPPTRKASSRAHDVLGEDLEGRPAVLELAAANGSQDAANGTDDGRPTLLAFLTSGCSVCLTFWQELGPDTETPGGARLVVVTKGVPDESARTLARLARPGLEVVASSGAWLDYDIPGSPYFVLVEDGVVTGEGSATSWPAVRDLLGQAVDESAEARARAGRAGPGMLLGDPGPGGRDDLGRIDAELLAAGIQPGHPSLHTSPEPPDDAPEPRT